MSACCRRHVELLPSRGMPSWGATRRLCRRWGRRGGWRRATQGTFSGTELNFRRQARPLGSRHTTSTNLPLLSSFARQMPVDWAGRLTSKSISRVTGRWPPDSCTGFTSIHSQRRETMAVLCGSERPNWRVRAGASSRPSGSIESPRSGETISLRCLTRTTRQPMGSSGVSSRARSTSPAGSRWMPFVEPTGHRGCPRQQM